MVDAPKNTDGPPQPERGGTSRIGFFGRRRSLQSAGDALQPEAAPSPPSSSAARKRHPLVATASGVLSFLGIAAVASIALLSLGLQRIHAPGPLPSDKVVYIASGSDTGSIVDQLEREGVIDSWPLMTAALYLRREHKPIKAGEYLFKQNASLGDVAETLISGKQILHSVTIPEGLTSEQIVERLRDNDVLAGDIDKVPPEGSLMPDTFKVVRGTRREALIQSMQSEQKSVVAEVWAHRASDTPIRSSYEMLTLASIVEKETGRADERPRVAGVFINRLSRNMPLQSDPTIVYGLVGGKGTLGRGILRSELDQRTPYNTYQINGLPPGPICNPGRAAMEAVANPSRTKDIYFVADGTGGHVFAETLEQHRQNVQRWRQIEKDAKDKAAPDPDKVLQSTPAGASKQNQRGDLAPVVPVFGALGRHFGVAHAGGLAAQMMNPAEHPLSFADSDRALSQLKPMIAGNDGAADEGDLYGTAGVGTGRPAAMSAEEAALATQSGGDGGGVSFPVPAARRADEKAQAAQYGLSPGSDRLPPQTELISTDPAAAAAAPGGRPYPGKGRIIDASEGTRLDPLLNKTYDLNSPKEVPSVKSGSFGALVAN